MAHKGARNDLTAEYVRSLLDYDRDTGVLTWKKCPSRHSRRIGTPAGCQRRNGKIVIAINNHYYLAHRLIWLIMTGEWPDEIDHRDRDPSNNRWENIRAATRWQNLANRGRSSRNTSGFKGVHFFKAAKRYQAYIMFNKKREHIGYFDTAEEAYAAYCSRAKELHGEFYSHD